MPALMLCLNNSIDFLKLAILASASAIASSQLPLTVDLAFCSLHDLAFNGILLFMDTVGYKKMADQIQAEIESLEIQQEEIERRIARLRQALLGLVPLAAEASKGVSLVPSQMLTEMQAMSITDAVRQILQATNVPLAPTEIKAQLINMGKDLNNQKNVMASIHSLLKRLADNHEIETRDNGLTYQWQARHHYRRRSGGLVASLKGGINEMRDK